MAGGFWDGFLQIHIQGQQAGTPFGVTIFILETVLL
jgi:hypothetical protein